MRQVNIFLIRPMTSVEHCLNRVIIHGSFHGAKHQGKRLGHQLEQKDVDKSLVGVLHAETVELVVGTDLPSCLLRTKRSEKVKLYSE